MVELAIVSVYIWMGFVGAISFMEAWLKFRAPGVGLKIGLSIGQLVFTALNRVEWTLAFLLLGALLLNIESVPNYFWGIILLPISFLFIQSMVLLPRLKVQAQEKIRGNSSQKSSIHIYYIIFELIKVVTLAGIGYMLFKF